MLKNILCLLILSIAFPSWAVIDMKNSNFADSWTDISLPGTGYELRVKRTYNSRSLFNGIFGFGWCSDYETKLEVTAENGILLTECGGGMQVSYTASNHNPKLVQSTIQKIIAGIKKQNKSVSTKELNKLKKELVHDQHLRVALVKRLNLEGKVTQGKVYRANGREAETVVLKGKEYIRTLANGTNQKFDLKGRLTHMYDKNRNYIKIIYSKNKITKITKIADNSGRQILFHYSPDGKIKYITGPNNLKVAYKFKGEDLLYAKNQWKESFTYSYDDLHNMTKIKFDDGTYKSLTYNKDRDWITSFRNRKGCVETYDYKIDKKSKFDHYWSTVVKKCNGKVTNNSSYEFTYKGKSNTSGEQYLHQVKSNVNGDKTTVTYHPIFGKPVHIVQNGLVTAFSYNDVGFMSSKKEPYRHFSYKYDSKCSKVSEVYTRFFGQNLKGKKRKVIKTTRSKFYYDKVKCNLKSAKNSDGQTVVLNYDSKGRISKITDQSKKIVSIKYEEKFGKPKLVDRPGLGQITVTYTPTGEIKNVKSKQGPGVAVQVANVFNNLLELIGPATTELSL